MPLAARTAEELVELAVVETAAGRVIPIGGIDDAIDASPEGRREAERARLARRVQCRAREREVADRLRHELETRHFKLLEKLAEYVAGVVLEDFGAAWVRVSVAKIGVLRGVKRVGVTIERSRAA